MLICMRAKQTFLFMSPIFAYSYIPPCADKYATLNPILYFWLRRLDARIRYIPFPQPIHMLYDRLDFFC